MLQNAVIIGVVSTIGFIILIYKCGIIRMLRLELALEIVMTLIIMIFYSKTATGLLAGAIIAVLFSVCISLIRGFLKLFGKIRRLNSINRENLELK